MLKQSLLLAAAAVALAGCQTQTGTNVNLVNANANVSNAFANSANVNAANTMAGTSAVETREPEEYQATVKMSLEAVGETQKATLPTISANVGRSGNGRVMEFDLPNGERVIYLDKAGTNYLILPNRKQYAELNRESTGFEIRRMLMPEQIVNQVKNLQGVKFVGEETMNGRQVMKYAYEGTTNTQTQAGQVATESFLIVDKETGLPLRSETVSESQSGANVQGYKGFRVVTEMTNIKTTPDAAMFTLPPDYAKIDAEQVRAQVNLVFNAVAALVGQALQQAKPIASPTAAVSPSPSM